jgi:hypothetical protein
VLELWRTQPAAAAARRLWRWATAVGRARRQRHLRHPGPPRVELPARARPRGAEEAAARRHSGGRQLSQLSRWCIITRRGERHWLPGVPRRRVRPWLGWGRAQRLGCGRRRWSSWPSSPRPAPSRPRGLFIPGVTPTAQRPHCPSRRAYMGTRPPGWRCWRVHWMMVMVRGPHHHRRRRRRRLRRRPSQQTVWLALYCSGCSSACSCWPVASPRSPQDGRIRIRSSRRGTWRSGGGDRVWARSWRSALRGWRG